MTIGTFIVDVDSANTQLLCLLEKSIFVLIEQVGDTFHSELSCFFEALGTRTEDYVV